MGKNKQIIISQRNMLRDVLAAFGVPVVGETTLRDRERILRRIDRHLNGPPGERKGGMFK